MRTQKDIGELISRWLDHRGMTQKQFADTYVCKPSTISMWVTGARKPSALRTIRRIASVFGVDESEFLAGPAPQATEEDSSMLDAMRRNDVLQIIAGLEGEDLKQASDLIKRLYSNKEKKSA